MSKLTPVTYAPILTNITIKQPDVFVDEFNLCKELLELNKKYTKEWFRTSNNINVNKAMSIDLMLNGVLHGIYTNKPIIVYTSLKKYNDSSNANKNIAYYLTLYNPTDRAIFMEKYNKILAGFVAGHRGVEGR